MIFVPIVLAVIAFAGGLWLSAAFVPPLRRTRTGRVATRVVELLLGAALVVLVLDAYTLIRTITEFGEAEELVFAREVSDLLWSAGSLVALAAIVHLLAPGFEEDELPSRASPAVHTDPSPTGE